MTDNQDNQPAPAPVSVCALCNRPFTAGEQRVYMGLMVGKRDVWAHASCYNTRYHKRDRAEPAAEVQGVMEWGE